MLGLHDHAPAAAVRRTLEGRGEAIGMADRFRANAEPLEPIRCLRCLLTRVNEI